MENKHLRKDDFFKAMNKQYLTLTYGDVRLEPGYSNTAPNDVDIASKFSRNIPLKIPIVSAAMDTVTEYPMGIEMAKLGGLGVIHKNLSPEDQAAHVAKVKHHLNGKIENPITVSQNMTIEEILNMREEKGYSFHTFPVLDDNGKLVGVLSETEFDFCRDINSKAKAVMTTNLITGDSNLDLNNAYDLMMEKKKKSIPLIDDDNKLVGLYVFNDVKRIHDGDSKIYNTDSKGRLRIAAAIGVGEKSLRRLELLVNKDLDVVVIDTAHGDTESVYDTLKGIKNKYSNLDVVVGNISIPESAKRLADAGADGIKVGQGPGAICTTRIIAGIGTPQVSAIYNCEKIIRGNGIPIIADGGLIYSGDVTIAIGAGAHSVMMGSMLAGTDESPGEIIFQEGRRWKLYRGMGSKDAMEANAESRERYRQTDSGKSVPEGVSGLTPYKGPLNDVVFQYIGGLRSGMGYVGAANIEELREKAMFRRITGAGQIESHPHNLGSVKEAPNYAGR